MTILFLVIPVVLFFILIVLPQRAQVRRQQALQAALREGMEVMTTSGIYGVVTRLRDDTLDLEIAPGVVITVARPALGRILDGLEGPGTAEPGGAEGAGGADGAPGDDSEDGTA